MRIFKRGAWVAVAAVALALLFTASAYAAPSGAIHTTKPYGEIVNGNIYAAKADVFLTGGPGPNAPQWAAGLPDGDYYFMVTDPPGKTLLSTDPIEDRIFTVKDGVIIDDGKSVHLLQDDTFRGVGKVVQLIPFLDTPNNGGVYKAWATPVGKYDPDGNGAKFGFVPAFSKTDNFKIKEPGYCFDVLKFKDLNWNGIKDRKDPYITGWPVHIIETLEDGQAFDYWMFTPVNCFQMVPGATYSVYEGMMDGEWYMTALYVNGKNIFPGIDYATIAAQVMAPKGKATKAVPCQTIVFGNGICEWSSCDYADCPYCDDCDTGACVCDCCSCRY
jgi:hypothetical protein